MNPLHLSLIMFAVIIYLGFGLEPAHADDANSVYIQNIKVQPSTVKVGDSFTVTVSLVNNSTVPIVVEGGTCIPIIKDVPLFTLIFDNHTKITSKNLTCAGVGLSTILNPKKTITGTSPDSTLFYIADKSGTANVTVAFSYYVKNQTDPTQPNIEQTISKSLLFTIYDNDTIGKSLKLGNHPVTNKISSPLKQFKSGIKAKDVQCTEGLILVIKTSNGSPACVKPTSVKRLVSLNWVPITELTIENFEDMYKAGEKIDFTIKYKGFYTCGYPSIMVTNMGNKTVWESPISLTLCDPDTGYGEYNWKFSELYTLILNETGSYHMIVSFSDKKLTKEFEIK